MPNSTLNELRLSPPLIKYKLILEFFEAYYETLFLGNNDKWRFFLMTALHCNLCSKTQYELLLLTML